MPIILDQAADFKTLLNCVNEVLKRTKTINSNTLLTSLTHTGKQNYIDIAVQAWNETIDQLYGDIKEIRPNALGEGMITIASGTREYFLASDLNILHYPLLDETNGRYIHEYPYGYVNLVNSQAIPANYTGLPELGAIRPSDGVLYLDKIPTVNEDGAIYKFRYEKDTELVNAADMVPFNDVVFRALVPAVAEKWKLDNKKEFNGGVYKRSIGTAARYLRRTPQNSSWLPQRGTENVTDPYA